MADPQRLLVVEDEINVGATLVSQLRRSGYDTSWQTSKAGAATQLIENRFDLVLLDIGLPDGSGLDLAPLIREKDQTTAIIFLTAFGAPEDRVKGLEIGASDYVVKPFHLQELLLRIKNCLDRVHELKQLTGAPTEKTKIGRAWIDFESFEADVCGKRISLTQKECSLLKLLLRRRGQVVSRDEILDDVWAPGEYPTPRTIDNFVVRVRKLVEPHPEKPAVIQSIRGVGYKMI